MSRWYLDENDRDIYWKDDKGLRWNYNTKELVRILNDLETKLRDVEQEQIQEMQEHQEAMELADKTIKNLVEDNRASQEWYKKQLADTEEQNKRVLEKLELIVRANQELEQKLAESEKKHLLDEKEWQDYCAFKHIEPQIKGCLDREREYEKELAEKEKQLAKYIDINNALNSGLKDRCFSCEEEHTKDKISFCIEQLEKVKEYIKTNLMSFQKVPIIQEINNQIKKVREMR